MNAITSNIDDNSVSQLDFRAAMSRVGASVNVITTAGLAGRGGFTATAMCSVTDTPPTLLVCMNKRSAQCAMFLANGVFCVNVLAHHHVDIAGNFAGKLDDMDARYATGAWASLPSGNYALSDAVATFDCVLSAHHEVGTHYVMFGEVRGLKFSSDFHPLLYLDRTFVGHTNTLGNG